MMNCSEALKLEKSNEPSRRSSVLNLRRVAIGGFAGDHKANLKPLEYLISFAVAEGPVAGLFRCLANE